MSNEASTSTLPFPPTPLRSLRSFHLSPDSSRLAPSRNPSIGHGTPPRRRVSQQKQPAQQASRRVSAHGGGSSVDEEGSGDANRHSFASSSGSEGVYKPFAFLEPRFGAQLDRMNSTASSNSRRSQMSTRSDGNARIDDDKENLKQPSAPSHGRVRFSSDSQIRFPRPPSTTTNSKARSISITAPPPRPRRPSASSNHQSRPSTSSSTYVRRDPRSDPPSSFIPFRNPALRNSTILTDTLHENFASNSSPRSTEAILDHDPEQELNWKRASAYKDSMDTRKSLMSHHASEASSEVDLDLTYRNSLTTGAESDAARVEREMQEEIELAREIEERREEAERVASSPKVGIGRRGLRSPTITEAWAGIGLEPSSQMRRGIEKRKERIGGTSDLREMFLLGGGAASTTTPHEPKGKGKEREPLGTRLETVLPVNYAFDQPHAPTTNRERAGSAAHQEWSRKLAVDPSLSLLVSDNAHSIGFAYNPTESVSGSLPTSPPLPSPPPVAFSTPKSLNSRIPLASLPSPNSSKSSEPLSTRIQGINPGAPLSNATISSPASGWSVRSFFLGSKQSTSSPATTPKSSNFSPEFEEGGLTVEADEVYSPDEPQSWADILASNALEYLGMIRSSKTASETPSSVFGGKTPSDFGISRASPNSSTGQIELENLGEEEPVEMTFYSRERGLGLDFSNVEPVLRNNYAPPIPPRSSPSPKIVRHRAGIPSLSVSRPRGDGTGIISYDDDDQSSDSSCHSALSPPADPSKRLSASRLFSPPTSRDRTRALAAYALSEPAPYPHFGALPQQFVPASAHHVPRPPSPVKSARFSFIPAPLSLVREHLRRATTYDAVPIASPLSASVAIVFPSTLPTSSHRRLIERQRPFSSYSMTEVACLPGTMLEEMVPAKIFFLAGFMFPAFWIIGGWWLRKLDGELWATRGTRCRGRECGCGRMLEVYSKNLQVTMKKDQGCRGASREKEDLWAGVDQWVFICRVASGAASLVVSVLVALAIAAASGSL